MNCVQCKNKIDEWQFDHYEVYGHYCIACDEKAEKASKEECDTGVLDYETLFIRGLLVCWNSGPHLQRLIENHKKTRDKKYTRDELVRGKRVSKLN